MGKLGILPVFHYCKSCRRETSVSKQKHKSLERRNISRPSEKSSPNSTLKSKQANIELCFAIISFTLLCGRRAENRTNFSQKYLDILSIDGELHMNKYTFLQYKHYNSISWIYRWSTWCSERFRSHQVPNFKSMFLALNHLSVVQSDCF